MIKTSKMGCFKLGLIVPIYLIGLIGPICPFTRPALAQGSQHSPATSASPRPGQSEPESPAPDQTPLTPTELLARTLSHNPALLADTEALAAARAEQRTQEALLWPMLAVNAQYTAGTTERMSLPVPEVEPANMSMRPRGLSANLNLTALYPIFTGGKFQARIEASKRRVEQLEANLAARRIELRAEVLGSLLSLRWQTAQAELLHSEIERQSQDLALAEQQLALGKIPRYMVLRAQSELALLNQAINLVHLEMHHQMAELRRLAVLPNDAALAELPALTLPETLGELPAPDLAERLAAERSPGLAALRAQLAEAETRVTIARAQYMPFIYLAGVIEQRFPENPAMDYTSGAAVDLLIALPVFDGFRRDAELERLQHDAGRLLNEYTDARNRLQTEATKLLLELDTLRVNLDLAAAAVEQLSEEDRIVRLRFAGGKAIQLEVLDTANQLRRARLDQLENWYRHERARLGFERLLALDSPEADQEITR